MLKTNELNPVERDLSDSIRKAKAADIPACSLLKKFKHGAVAGLRAPLRQSTRSLPPSGLIPMSWRAYALLAATGKPGRMTRYANGYVSITVRKPQLDSYAVSDEY